MQLPCCGSGPDLSVTGSGVANNLKASNPESDWFFLTLLLSILAQLVANLGISTPAAFNQYQHAEST